jgi:DNA end-binding protein Ku
MTRAMWKGTICLDEHNVPIKLYAAVQDRDVHFHLLHDHDQARVKQRMVNPGTGEPIPAEQIQRAYEAEPGVFVRVERDELEAIVPEASRRIEITHFVPQDAIEHPWFERPYYLGPDGEAAPYAALAQALAQEQRIGVAHWVMRKKRYAGALHAHAGTLRLFTLRKLEEVVDLTQLQAPAGRELEKRELALAEQLIATLSGDFEPTAFKDDHRERLLELIEVKRRGGKLKKPRVPRKAAPASLASALQASLKHMKKERASA